MSDMSFLFLECDDLRRLLPAATIPPCCPNCHARPKNQGKIYVSPLKEDGWNTDWMVCVQLVVCCAIYDFARSIDRSFYLQQGAIHNVGRDDGRGYIYPSQAVSTPSQPTSRAQSKASKPKRTIHSIREEEELGGLDSWRR